MRHPDADPVRRDLRALLRRWDPIGVFEDDDPAFRPPEDEYDCLIPGILERLDAGQGSDELFGFLEHEIVEHFGLAVRPGVDRAFAQEIADWWAARSG
jgi:hypothetical protein